MLSRCSRITLLFVSLLLLAGCVGQSVNPELERLRARAENVEIIRDDRAQEVDRARGFRKVGFQVPDVEAVADRVERATGDRPRVIDFARFGVRIVQLRDPDGSIIQLSSPLEDQN